MHAAIDNCESLARVPCVYLINTGVRRAHPVYVYGISRNIAPRLRKLYYKFNYTSALVITYEDWPSAVSARDRIRAAAAAERVKFGTHDDAIMTDDPQKYIAACEGCPGYKCETELVKTDDIQRCMRCGCDFDPTELTEHTYGRSVCGLRKVKKLNFARL